MNRSATGRLRLPLMAFILIGFTLAVRAQQAPSPLPSLPGAWLVTSTPSDGTPRFQALFTFTESGGLIETDTASTFVPVGHGAWSETGDREFSTTFLQFVSNSKGALDNTVKVRETITVNEAGDSYTSRFQSLVMDRTGKTVYSGTGTGTGTRIRVEPRQ
jgi:hypothetical protein